MGRRVSGSGGGGGGISIRNEYIFADATARDTYFSSHSTELIEGLYIVTNGTLQRYISSAWVDHSSVIGGTHATTHATGGTDALTPAAIGAEPADSAIQAHITAAHAPATAEANVQADWNATTGDAYIQNKPDLGGAALLDVGTGTGTVAAGDDSRFTNTNLVINGGFTVNQRRYISGATKTTGLYAHDRWKAGESGGAYTFTQLTTPTQITIISGSFVQVVEGCNIDGNVYVLSWDGTATGRIGKSGATPSGSYGVSPVIITDQIIGQSLSLEFTGGTLGDVKLERGSVSTPFLPVAFGEELWHCKHYCLVLGGNGAYETLSSTKNGYSTTACFISIPLNPPMRATPSLVAPANVNHFILSDAVNIVPLTSMAITASSTPQEAYIGCGVAGGLVQFRPYYLAANNQTTDLLILEAEV